MALGNTTFNPWVLRKVVPTMKKMMSRKAISPCDAVGISGLRPLSRRYPSHCRPPLQQRHVDQAYPFRLRQFELVEDVDHHAVGSAPTDAEGNHQVLVGGQPLDHHVPKLRDVTRTRPSPARGADLDLPLRTHVHTAGDSRG